MIAFRAEFAVEKIWFNLNCIDCSLRKISSKLKFPTKLRVLTKEDIFYSTRPLTRKMFYLFKRENVEQGRSANSRGAYSFYKHECKTMTTSQEVDNKCWVNTSRFDILFEE